MVQLAFSIPPAGYYIDVTLVGSSTFHWKCDPSHRHRQSSINFSTTYHEGECQRYLFNTLDDPHQHHAHYLYDGKHVNSIRLHVTQVDVVRLVLGGHQENQNPLDELCERENARYFFSRNMVLSSNLREKHLE